MLHQCGHQSSASPCTCGVLYGGCSGGGASFSILFPMGGASASIGDKPYSMMDYEAFDASTSSVDCTLSLGTPSTRHSEYKDSSSASHAQRSSTYMPSVCWDLISGQSKKSSSASSGGGGTAGGSSLGGDPLLLARRCVNCDTTSTPLWRNGPRGPKSLCNACGIRYKKEERRAAASTASPSPSSSVVTVAADNSSAYGYYRQQQSPWAGCYSSASMKSSSMYDEMADDGEASYMSWRLNVMPTAAQFPVRDRPSLFQFN